MPQRLSNQVNIECRLKRIFHILPNEKPKRKDVAILWKWGGGSLPNMRVPSMVTISDRSSSVLQAGGRL